MRPAPQYQQANGGYMQQPYPHQQQQHQQQYGNGAPRGYGGPGGPGGRPGQMGPPGPRGMPNPHSHHQVRSIPANIGPPSPNGPSTADIVSNPAAYFSSGRGGGGHPVVEPMTSRGRLQGNQPPIPVPNLPNVVEPVSHHGGPRGVPMQSRQGAQFGGPQQQRLDGYSAEQPQGHPGQSFTPAGQPRRPPPQFAPAATPQKQHQQQQGGGGGQGRGPRGIQMSKSAVVPPTYHQDPDVHEYDFGAVPGGPIPGVRTPGQPQPRQQMMRSASSRQPAQRQPVQQPRLIAPGGPGGNPAVVRQGIMHDSRLKQPVRPTAIQEHLIDHYGLELDASSLVHPDVPPNVTPIENTRQALTSIATQNAIVSDAIKKEVVQLQAVSSAVKCSQIDGTLYFDVLQQLYDELEAAARDPKLRDALMAAGAEEQALQYHITRWVEARRNADTVDSILEAYREEIKLLDDLESNIRRQLDITNKVRQNERQERGTVLTTSCTETLDGIDERLTKLSTKADADFQRVQVALTDKQEEFERQRDANIQEATKMREVLDVNRSQQDETKREIARLQELLTTLQAEERSTQQQLNDVSAKGQRDGHDYHIWTDNARSWMRLLKAATEIKEANSVVVSELKGALSTAETAVNEHYKQQASESTDIYETLLKKHLESFRLLFISTGELLNRKLTRKQDLGEELRLAKVKHASAQYSLNPRTDAIAGEVTSLEREVEGLTQEMEVLQGRFREAAKRFEPTEAALKEAGIEFSHPVDELNERLTNERKAEFSRKRAISREGKATEEVASPATPEKRTPKSRSRGPGTKKQPAAGAEAASTPAKELASMKIRE